MFLDRASLGKLLLNVADLWDENTGILNAIDAEFGDGDHGVTIGKISRVFRQSVDGWGEQPVKGFLSTLGMAVMGVGGGSAGPLYGTLVDGLGGPLAADATTIDAAALKAMFASSQSELSAITKATVGDKTMMDALIPAVAAAQACDGDIADILQAAAQAAADGAEATKDMVSKFGRARSYGERTLGTADAGALSTALFFQGLSQGLD